MQIYLTASTLTWIFLTHSTYAAISACIKHVATILPSPHRCHSWSAIVSPSLRTYSKLSLSLTHEAHKTLAIAGGKQPYNVER